MTDISSACFSFSNHVHMYKCWLCCVVFTQQIFMISFYLFFQVRFFPSSSFHIFWWPWQMSSDFLKLFYISEAFGVWNWMRVTDWGAGIEYNLTVSIEMSQNVQFQDRLNKKPKKYDMWTAPNMKYFSKISPVFYICNFFYFFRTHCGIISRRQL